MFLIIDNYDSFVHNLARYVALAGEQDDMKYEVVRNDAITIQEIKTLAPEAIILSPGPRAPADAGICIEAIKTLGPSTPMLGVCLGHQAIGEAYGGKTITTPPMHGKTSQITHDCSALFAKTPSPMTVGRYHSLATELPEDSPLKTTAQTQDGIIMAMQHETHPVYGVQFHPESILTEHGQDIIDNFHKLTKRWNFIKQEAA